MVAGEKMRSKEMYIFLKIKKLLTMCVHADETDLIERINSSCKTKIVSCKIPEETRQGAMQLEVEKSWKRRSWPLVRKETPPPL